MIETPIVIFGYRRPDLLEGALEQVVHHKAKRIHVILDGAPHKKPKILEQTDLCRKVLAKSWPGLDLVPHLAEINLGCRQRVLTGLDAVFLVEKEAIILEDDIRVGSDFFILCKMALEKFLSDNPSMV